MNHLFRNPWLLAPMAGVSEMPFRVLALEFGAGAAPTELVSAKGLIYGQARTERYMRHADCEKADFWVQIFGGEIDSMVAGAVRAVELGAKRIDVNMGCPVKKVTKHGAGSALLADPQRAGAMVAAIGRATGVPVTAKIRAGWDADSLNYLEMGRALEQGGAQAISLHARTRAQGYSGTANWQFIRDLVQAVRIPVIGNGDAMTAKAARQMLAQTGCAAVMIGRGALGNPWIFQQLVDQQDQAPTAAQRWAVVRRHLALHLDFVADPKAAIRRFRPHLMWYAHGLQGAAQFRATMTSIDDLAELQDVGEAFFSRSNKAADQHEQAVAFDERLALG